MIPYTIIDYNTTKKQVTIRLRDVLGNKHDLVVTADGLANHELGIGYVQDNFKELSDNDRELLMTGIPPSMWDDMFNEKFI